MNNSELRARVRSLMRLKRFTDELDSAESIILSLALTVEARDTYTGGHCERMAAYAATLGMHLGLSVDEVGALRRGGYLHDIGKVAIPDSVLQAMQRPAVDIYSGEMIGVTDGCLKDLASVFRTRGRTYIYAANGHGGWEAALTNVLSRGQTVLALESGRFAIGWGEMGRMLGVEVEVTLRRPPPLDRPLRVRVGDGGAVVHDGDQLVAEAHPATVALAVPAAAISACPGSHPAAMARLLVAARRGWLS